MAPSVIANFSEPVHFGFWETLDLQKYTFVLPAWITCNGKQDPVGVFQTLFELQDSSFVRSQSVSLKYPLESVLESLNSNVERSIYRIERFVAQLNKPLQEFVRNLPSYKRLSNAYEIQDDNLEIIYAQSAIRFSSLVVSFDKFDEMIDKINQVRLMKKYHLDELPGLLENLALTEKKVEIKDLVDAIQTIAFCMLTRPE